MTSLKATVSPALLTSILSKMVSKQMPVMITGRPGIGKSQVVEQVAHATNNKLILSHPVVSDPVDYKGLPALTETGAEFIPFSDLKELIDATEPTIFFLDDLGQASPSVQAACMQLILARQINGHKVSDKVTFIAATNRRIDKAGVAGILEPVKSRFAIFELEPTLDDWVEWALTKDWIPLKLINACRYKPEWIKTWEPAKKGEIYNTPCPRNIVEVAKMINMDLSSEERFPAFASRLGVAAATELNAFLDLYSNLPKIKSIIDSPETAHVPENPSSLYALIGALAEAADKDTFGRILKYSDRISPEYQILFIKDAIKRKRELNKTREFVQWALANQNLLKIAEDE